MSYVFLISVINLKFKSSITINFYMDLVKRYFKFDVVPKKKLPGKCSTVNFKVETSLPIKKRKAKR